MKKAVKAWTVIFNSGYADGNLTYWSFDLHPIFTKRSCATSWAKELHEGAMLTKRPKVVPCIITYEVPTKKNI
jgi:hypothetical protein